MTSESMMYMMTNGLLSNLVSGIELAFNQLDRAWKILSFCPCIGLGNNLGNKRNERERR
jgi:hypothetical protein